MERPPLVKSAPITADENEAECHSISERLKRLEYFCFPRFKDRMPISECDIKRLLEKDYVPFKHFNEVIETSCQNFERVLARLEKLEGGQLVATRYPVEDKQLEEWYGKSDSITIPREAYIQLCKAEHELNCWKEKLQDERQGKNITIHRETWERLCIAEKACIAIFYGNASADYIDKWRKLYDKYKTST